MKKLFLICYLVFSGLLSNAQKISLDDKLSMFFFNLPLNAPLEVIIGKIKDNPEITIKGKDRIAQGDYWNSIVGKFNIHESLDYPGYDPTLTLSLKEGREDDFKLISLGWYYQKDYKKGEEQFNDLVKNFKPYFKKVNYKEFEEHASHNKVFSFYKKKRDDIPFLKISYTNITPDMEYDTYVLKVSVLISVR